ncbi:MAG: glutamine-hydrolyzing GMP synthase, partial [Pyrobaculum sp.]
MDKVLVVNFGGQYAHLIARRVRELGVYAEVVSPEDAPVFAKDMSVKAVVLSGGPSSVYERDAPDMSGDLLTLGKPLLGICYGHQLLARKLGGVVKRGKGEYGKTVVEILREDPLFHGWEREEVVWMSHGDYVEKPPEGFEILAVSENGYVAAMRRGDIYGVQFHPEVSHTAKGMLLIQNFLQRVVKMSPEWWPERQVERLIEEIKRAAPEGYVIVGVSGGIDSTVTAVLVHRAVGERAKAVFVDHGLFRE